MECIKKLRALSLLGNPLKSIEFNALNNHRFLSSLILNSIGDGQLVLHIDTISNFLGIVDLLNIDVNCDQCGMSWVAKMHSSYDVLKKYPRLKNHKRVIETMKCQGVPVLTFNKDYHKCVNRNWTPWSSWAKCSQSCGGGISWRKRSCGNHRSEQGTMPCNGQSTETRKCSNITCPDCHWTDWSLCTKSCGNGTKLRKFKCAQGTASNRKTSRIKDKTEVDVCNTVTCMANGQWSVWSPWTDCSVTCGKGLRARSRNCSNPPPKGNGEYCLGRHMESEQCNSNPCIVSATWSRWSDWSPCPFNCGYRYKFRGRTCRTNAQVLTSTSCIGKNYERQKCIYQDCLFQEDWSQWLQWTPCSKSCEGGIQRRIRECLFRKHLVVENFLCAGSGSEILTCSVIMCKGHEVNGWGQWHPWTPCSKTCGHGTSHRYRDCLSHRDLKRGKLCPGTKIESISCHPDVCFEISSQINLETLDITNIMTWEKEIAFQLPFLIVLFGIILSWLLTYLYLRIKRSPYLMKWIQDHAKWLPDLTKWMPDLKERFPNLTKWFEDHTKWVQYLKKRMPDLTKWMPDFKKWSPSQTNWFQDLTKWCQNHTKRLPDLKKWSPDLKKWSANLTKWFPCLKKEKELIVKRIGVSSSRSQCTKSRQITIHLSKGLLEALSDSSDEVTYVNTLSDEEISEFDDDESDWAITSYDPTTQTKQSSDEETSMISQVSTWQ